MAEPHAFDVPLIDTELLAEIQLTTDLVIAVQTFDRQLSRDEIDRLLQVDPAPGVRRTGEPSV